MKLFHQVTVILAIIFIPWSAQADMQSDVEFLYHAKNPPSGVVFEIVLGSRQALEWAIPETRRHIQRLRSRHPNMKFAVVSHGTEQFGLLTSEQKKQPKVHQKVRALVEDESVPIHICGTHASWYDKDEKDFPDYVSVVPAGPAKIRQYQRDGYALIVIER